MLTLDLDLDSELGELEAQLLLSIPQIQRAVNRALRKTARWLETHTKRELGKALALPQQVFNVRYRQSFYLKGESRAVNVWFGLNPVHINQLGEPEQTYIGVKIGRRMFTGAFVATMDNGHTSVFRRSKNHAKNRRVKRPDGQWTELPIERETIAIADEARTIFERYYLRAESRFKELLKQEINYVLNVESQ